MSGFVLQLVLCVVPNNWAEELAWTGFVQARLQDRLGAARAALAVAPLFALQHISLVVGGSVVEGALLLGLLAVLSIPFRFLTGWAYNRTSSLFLIGLIHAAGNAVAGGSGFGDGFLRRLYPDSGLPGLVAHLLAFAVIGLVVLIATRGRLGAPTAPAGQGSDLQRSGRPAAPVDLRPRRGCHHARGGSFRPTFDRPHGWDVHSWRTSTADRSSLPEPAAGSAAPRCGTSWPPAPTSSPAAGPTRSSRRARRRRPASARCPST